MSVNDNKNSAYDLGGAAYEQVVERASNVFEHERERHLKTNEAEIARLKHRQIRLDEREKELRKILDQAPDYDPSSLRWKWWRNIILAGVLMVGGIVFAYIALQPFGLGWMAGVYAIGLGIVAAILTDQLLDHFNGRLRKLLCIAAFLAALSGGVLLGIVRGEIVSLQVQNAVQEDVTGTEEPQGPSRAEDFYLTNTRRLTFALALLTVAMELGAGLLLHDLQKFDLSIYRRAEDARRELREVQDEKESVVGQIRFRENEPEIVKAAARRDFGLGVLGAINKGGTLPAVLLGLFLLLPGNASAQPRPTAAVIAVDLTLSVASQGYDGKTEFAKNLSAACNLIRSLPPGTQLTVIAITDRSFTQPYILLSRQIPNNNGKLPLLDQIAVAKRTMSTELDRMAKSLKPQYRHTDILGALFLAADILKQRKDTRKWLILLSDMRQETPEFDLETPEYVAVGPAIDRAGAQHLVADLGGVEVWALGVHGDRKSFAYWRSLQQFWTTYFTRAGAELKAYSPNRQVAIQ